MSFEHRLGTGIALIALVGCSSMDVLTKKQTETEGRLEQILQSSTTQRAQTVELSRELQDLKHEITALQHEPGGHSPEAIQLIDPVPAEKDSESSVQAAYMKAFGLFSSNRYDEAVTAFSQFIAAYPESEYAENAHYWIGECHYTRHDYLKALEAFNMVLIHYPQGKKVPDAMLKAAFSQLGLNDRDNGRAMLRKLVESYPKSAAAAKARERLNLQQ
jgi:tol-pal system protein YbgF